MKPWGKQALERVSGADSGRPLGSEVLGMEGRDMALAEELGFQVGLEHTPYIYYHINHIYNILSILYYIIYIPYIP